MVCCLLNIELGYMSHIDEHFDATNTDTIGLTQCYLLLA